MNLLYRLLGLGKGEVRAEMPEPSESERWLDKYTKRLDRFMRNQESCEIAYLNNFYR